MQITKKGKLHNLVGMDIICEGCSCEYKVSELKDIGKSISKGGYWILCPECGKEKIITTGTINQSAFANRQPTLDQVSTPNVVPTPSGLIPKRV